MAFMSYYRLEGTVNEMRKCIDDVNEATEGARHFDEDDKRHAAQLYRAAQAYIDAYEDYLEYLNEAEDNNE